MEIYGQCVPEAQQRALLRTMAMLEERVKQTVVSPSLQSSAGFTRLKVETAAKFLESLLPPT